MGTVLLVIGLGWALLGVLNLVGGLGELEKQGFGDTAKGFALIFNMTLLILPGLVLAGIGQGLRRRRRTAIAPSGKESPTSDTTVCPFCAETIKRAATVCRYCQRTLPVADQHPPSLG